MPGSDDDLLSIAEALYAGRPAAFVAERAARAKQARAAGDRDLAARITALPKPSAAASLVNRLVADGGGLDRVLELGAELRAAQEEGDRDRLRALGAERRDLLAEVTRSAAEQAEESGRKPSAAVLEDVQQTLQAVLIDDGAADAVRTGRLVHALTADGLDPADLTDAIGGPGAISSPRATTGRKDDDRSRNAEAARARAEAARREADDAADRTHDAEQEVQQRDETVQDLTARIAELQEHLESAQATLTEARRAADAAHTAEAELQAAADEAEALSGGL